MLWQVTLDLIKGFGQNIIIFFVTLIVALPFGMIVTFGEMSKISPIRLLCKTIVWIIRGTPLLLQLFLVYYVPGLVFGVPFTLTFWNIEPQMIAALIAFSINYAMYFAEIYRGALENIPKGQYEAGKVLGLSKRQVFFHVILFQVVKRITAPIGNEVITLVKDTAMARVIGIQDMSMQAMRYTTQGYIWPLYYSIVFYLAWTAIVTVAFAYFERRVKRAVGEEPV